MSQPYVGQIIAVGFYFAPIGWLMCDGSTQPISEYQVLYTLLGTTYGGDGQTTFGVPDLRGRAPLGYGQGPGLANYPLGQKSGLEGITLTVAQIGAHTHNLQVNNGATSGGVNTPGATVYLATASSNANAKIFSPAAILTALAGGSIGSAPGGATPHENRQPFQVVNWIIATTGLFPPQS